METKVNKVKLSIDGKEVLVDDGLTILEAARQNGIDIPTLCQHEALSNWGGCRMCVVEVDGSPKLIASCVMPVRSGMAVVTTNDYILECRRTMMEFIFAERNHNCMFCPQSGDCELQKLAYELQMDHLTVAFSFNKFPTDVTSEYMAIDHNRCILCGRCVRACKEIVGASVLNFQNRGPKNLIGMDLDETREQSSCYGCGICMQVCPTGAMVNRYRSHYAVKGHSKDWQPLDTVCSQCGLLCPTVNFVKDNNLLNIEGKLTGDNGRPDRGQLCYKGRFEALKNTGKRLDSPMVRSGNGTWEKSTWDEILKLVSGKLNDVKKKEGGEAIFGLASSAASNEELVLFRDFMTQGCSAVYVDTFDGAHFRTVAGVYKEGKEAFREASWKMIPQADMVMLLGAAPSQSQPMISTLLGKGILQRSQKVAVLGETDPIQPYATYYIPVADGALPLLIGALKAGIKGSGDGGKLLEKAGLDADAVKAFHEVVKAFSDSVNPLFVVGEKLTGLEDPAVLADIASLAKQKGLYPDNTLRLIILKPRGNSAGAWKMGISSSNKVPGKSKWKAGLVLLGEPDDSYLAALEGLKSAGFVAAISPYFPESLADQVDALIPKPAWLEEEGTFTSVEGHETAYKQKTLQAPAGVMDSWEIFKNLAERVGFKPEYQSWKNLSKKAEHEIKK
ncbi:MAG: molybdopterin-dependent oxidoreductase [Desulfobacterales bacterium]|nr:molybdopterin-dependent oxidoreductase [Desulfobacterales bacterium]